MDQDGSAATGLMALFAGGIGIMFLLISLAAYIFFSYCIKLIAEKSGHGDSAALWWVPIINLLILLKVANKPAWWLVLYIIPFVNFVVSILVMMEVAKARGKEAIWGLVAALLPIVGLPYLAFSDSDGVVPAVS